MAQHPYDSMRELLERIIRARQPDLLPLLDLIGHTPLAQDQCESLRGAVAWELASEGLDEQDEPNAYGLALESLIDWLGHN